MEERDEIRRYAHLREHYWSNAQIALKEEEYEKASEFTWGSVSQLLRYLASVKGIPLRTHGDVKEFAKEIARELQNEDVLLAFKEAEKLHANFYNAFLEPADIILAMEQIRRGMEVLLRHAKGG